jgi:rhodanese-related sulfurtransferase
VDVREDNEWAAGHALGSIHLSKGILERDIESVVPDSNTPMVLYCGGGYRSALAADALQKMGYSTVMSLDGGWRAYEASGLPLAPL